MTGKALKLTGVDFSNNALAQVNFTEEIPCTAVALDYNTLSFENVEETKTLTATVTPANTTDTLIWSTSNENVASVEDGVVTIHGIGSVTITATCGSQSATCSISQTSIKAAGTLKILSGYSMGSYQNALNISATSGNILYGGVYTNDDKLRVINGAAQEIEAILVPYGASKVKVATENDTEITFNYMYYADSTEFIVYYSKNYPKYLGNVTFAKSKTGKEVTPGNCIAFRCTSVPADTPTYVYFE